LINEPEAEILAMSSATKEVATLRSGILNSFEMMLKMETETPAEANSRVPSLPSTEPLDQSLVQQVQVK
jgi:hypothetical protein